MTVLEKLADNPREFARELSSAVARGCPPEVEECKKDADGWDACDECFYKWLTTEARL